MLPVSRFALRYTCSGKVDKQVVKWISGENAACKQIGIAAHLPRRALARVAHTHTRSKVHTLVVTWTNE